MSKLSDESDDSCDDQIIKTNNDNNDNEDEIVKNDLNPLIRPSPKLAIFDQSKQSSNIKSKFSIWSDVLMEQQLTDTMDETLQIKDRRSEARRRKRLKLKQKQLEQQQQQNDAENYFQWTKEDFERKFAPTKPIERKTKRKRKTGIVGEIAYKLKEPRTDIIKNIVDVLGEQRARQLTAEVLDIEDVGGLLIDGDEQKRRKRSPGGTLFYMIKHDSTITDEQRRKIFNNREVKEFNRNLKKKFKQKQRNQNGNNKNKSNKKIKNKKQKRKNKK